MTYILFDIGGKKTRVGKSDDLQSLEETVSFATPNDITQGVKAIVDAVKTLTNKAPTALAGGIRGILTEDKTGIVNDAVLTKWVGESVVDEFAKYFDVPVTLENDTAVAGVGEAVFGAGKGLEIVAYHTVGAGVGGVKIENGAIDVASVGFEPGHQVLDIDRTVLGDEIDPTLENLVSATALQERFGVPPEEIPQSDVVWDELAEYLAQGMRNTILYWSPDVIVLGGPMITGDPKIDIDVIRKYTVTALDGFVDCPHITVAKLGDMATLYGAMAILKQV